MHKLPVPMPDGFKCPYARQCWQREAFRWIATAVIAAAFGSLASCATHAVRIAVETPKISLEVETTPAPTAPTTAPAK